MFPIISLKARGSSSYAQFATPAGVILTGGDSSLMYPIYVRSTRAILDDAAHQGDKGNQPAPGGVPPTCGVILTVAGSCLCHYCAALVPKTQVKQSNIAFIPVAEPAN